MYRSLKRAFDILIAVLSLIIFLPVLLPIAVILKFTGEGHVFYRQDRIGYKNESFSILKFATMLKDSPNIGTGTITLQNDPRVTPLGRFLRSSKLNELPQVINVLRGDMSIVGPRPVDQSAFSKYDTHIQDRIYNIRPGITGIGSIIFRGEDVMISESGQDPHEYMKDVIAPYKGKVELWYQEKASFWTDIKIIALTAIAIISPKSNTLCYKIFKDMPRRDL